MPEPYQTEGLGQVVRTHTKQVTLRLQFACYILSECLLYYSMYCQTFRYLSIYVRMSCRWMCFRHKLNEIDVNLQQLYDE